MKGFLQNVFYFFFVFVTLGFFLSIFDQVYASDYKADYQVEYNLSELEGGLKSKVKFNIKITNLASDVYVDKYSIGFPPSFAVSDIRIQDDHGEVIPKITENDQGTKVEMAFSNPNIGKNSVNNLYINFDQTNLFKVNGNIWEVAIPVIETKQDETYQVVVNLPTDTDKKISISKPKPSSISGKEIRWLNPKAKTIYAVFGDSQIYQVELRYNLKNSEIFPVMTEIAFPPDNLYQKIYIDSILPRPQSVYQDIDGNYLGKYKLSPLETKTVVYRGIIEIFPKPREEVIPYIRKLFGLQEGYLTGQQKYWTIKSLDKISGFKSVDGAYNFTVSSLKYDYGKITGSNSRLGAEEVMSKPNQAVCMEFTDLFIAISREKGISSREVQGYGFSYDPQLQPLSLAADILHSWPEYYDRNLGIWIPVDPTWENTSGIDYFSSFDLNHIAFAVHGKRSDYPVPAGMYKIGNSKDISISAVTSKPKDESKIEIKEVELLKKITDSENHQGSFKVVNNGNTYKYQLPIEISGDGVEVLDGKKEVDSLAPFEEKELRFEYRTSENKNKSKGVISIFVNDGKVLERAVDINSSFYSLGTKILIGLLVLLSITIFFFKKRDR